VDPVSLFLLTVAAIFLIGIAGEIVFERTGVPDVVWLILVGIVLGPITGFVQREQLIAVAPYFGALTLVVVLFDGGSGLRLDELSQAAGRSAALAVATFVCSILVLAPVSMAISWTGWLPEEWTWTHAIMLGAILGGSSSVVIMPAVRKAGLAPRIANLVNLESALTDVLCVVVTVACVNVAVSGQADAGSAALTLLKSFGIGVGVGAAVGFVGLLFLRRLKKSAYAYPLILGTLLVLYVVVDEMQGSAALAVLTVAVIFGNARELSKVVGLAKSASLGRGVEGVHDQITFIIKSFFFTFIGAMLSPPWGDIALGVLIGLMLLLARAPGVAASLAGSGLSRPAKMLVTVAMPRGMAAGVLAMVPSQEGVEGTGSLPVVVFASVLTSILIFAVGFPVLKKKLAVVDPSALLPASAHTPAHGHAAADASMSTLGSLDDSLDDSLPPPKPTTQPADATTPDQAIPLTRERPRDEAE
jgi:cell volume regulation protein A